MTPEKPAKGIVQVWEYTGTQGYEVRCSCGSNDHKLFFTVDRDDETNDIIVTTYVTVSTDYWNTFFDVYLHDIENPWLYTIACSIKGFLNAIATRVKLLYNILVHGYIKYEQDIIMPKQVALNYATTIQNAVEYLEIMGEH